MAWWRGPRPTSTFRDLPWNRGQIL